MDVHQVTDAEMLQHLADQPIGSPELQEQANRLAPQVADGALRKADIPADLAETIKRTSKIWLPQGKKASGGPEAKEAEAAFYERQIDIEDAVEAAGGKRGGLVA